MSKTVYNLTEWIKSLPVRAGWGAWDSVGSSVYEGVQCWSANGDESTAVGVWGNVTLPSDDKPSEVQWCIYVGDSRDPEKCGFDDAEAAMRWAELTFPNRFNAAANA